MRMWVWSLAMLSGLRIQSCHKLWCRSQMRLRSALLWLWYRWAAAAPIGPLAWELPYAAGAAVKRKKFHFCFSTTWCPSAITHFVAHIFLPIVPIVVTVLPLSCSASLNTPGTFYFYIITSPEHLGICGDLILARYGLCQLPLLSVATAWFKGLCYIEMKNKFDMLITLRSDSEIQNNLHNFSWLLCRGEE